MWKFDCIVGRLIMDVSNAVCLPKSTCADSSYPRFLPRCYLPEFCPLHCVAKKESLRPSHARSTPSLNDDCVETLDGAMYDLYAEDKADMLREGFEASAGRRRLCQHSLRSRSKWISV
jgi:hypothetical protein